jgi:hypothetical protein
MAESIEFYLEHAGSSHDPKVETPEEGKYRCAEELRYAASQAEQFGWYFEWDDDPEEPDWGDVNPTDEERDNAAHLMVVLKDEHGRVLASLGGILVDQRDAPVSPYCVVVEAELALEAVYEREALTCGTCDRKWIIPTPASRCPFEAHHVDDDDEPKTMTYRSRDIGYGVETGEVYVPAFGQADWCGKKAYMTTENTTVYLFDDELCGSDPLSHVLTDDERTFIETSIYVEFEEGTTIKSALVSEIMSTLWAQIESPSDRWYAMLDAMHVDEEVADLLFNKVRDALVEALNKIEEEL